MPAQTTKLLAVAQIPDSDRLIRCGRDERAIRFREVERSDSVGVI